MTDTFSHALENQFRSLRSLIYFESNLRFARRSIGVIEELAGILIHVAGFAALRYLAGAPTHYSMPAIPFMTSGIFAFWMLRSNIMQASNFNIAKNRYMVLPRVTQLDVLTARCIVNTLLYIGVAMSVFYLFYFLGIGPAPYAPWTLVMIFCACSLWGYGTGLVLGSVFLFLPVVRTIFGGFTRVLMYTSGIMFIWPEVPYSFRYIVEKNPLFHMVEFVREAYFGTYISAMADPFYVFKWIILSLALGLVVERLCRPYALMSTHRGDDADFDTI